MWFNAISGLARLKVGNAKVSRVQCDVSNTKRSDTRIYDWLLNDKLKTNKRNEEKNTIFLYLIEMRDSIFD